MNFLKKWMSNCAKPGVASGSWLAFLSMSLFHRTMYKFTIKNLDILPNGRILDIGCGGGDFLARMYRRFPAAQFFGIDYSPLSVKRSISCNRKAVQEGKMSIAEGNVSSLPFPDNHFDAVTALATIYFWPDVQQNIQEVVRTLKPGGMFIVSSESMDEARANQFVKSIPGMVYYSPDKICDFFRQAGLVDVETRTEQGSAAVCVVGKKRRKNGNHFVQTFRDSGNHVDSTGGTSL